jgi:hypothetical protein
LLFFCRHADAPTFNRLGRTSRCLREGCQGDVPRGAAGRRQDQELPQDAPEPLNAKSAGVHDGVEVFALGTIDTPPSLTIHLIWICGGAASTMLAVLWPASGIKTRTSRSPHPRGAESSARNKTDQATFSCRSLHRSCGFSVTRQTYFLRALKRPESCHAQKLT